MAYSAKSFLFGLFTALLLPLVSITSTLAGDITIDRVYYGSDRDKPELLKYACDGDELKCRKGYFCSACAFKEFTNVLKNVCDNTESCGVSITNKFLGGDPCSGICKVAKIEWSCDGKSQKPEWVRENKTFRAQCK